MSLPKRCPDLPNRWTLAGGPTRPQHGESWGARPCDRRSGSRRSQWTSERRDPPLADRASFIRGPTTTSDHRQPAASPRSILSTP